MILHDFLSGAITFGFATAALFFLRFWKRTHDGLFAAFAIAFLLLGFAQALLSQALLSLAQIPVEERSWVFGIRLTAFLVILVAIVRKNSGGSASR